MKVNTGGEHFLVVSGTCLSSSVFLEEKTCLSLVLHCPINPESDYLNYKVEKPCTKPHLSHRNTISFAVFFYLASQVQHIGRKVRKYFAQIIKNMLSKDKI